MIMAGIESYATALPTLRIPASAYVAAWGSCGARGMKQKAFCAYDEDAITLAIEAARAALARFGRDVHIDALFLGVTTPPYDEKPSAATVPTALFPHADLRVTEIAGSPQAGVQALVSAVEFCAAKPGRYALAIAADAPEGPPDGSFEHALGAAAASFVVGPDGAAAELIDSFAVTRETFGARFRRHGDETISDLELRTRDNQMSLQALGRVAKLEKVKRVALGADAGLMRGAGRALGLPDAIVDGTWTLIGDAGAASAPFALAAALDEARAGETVLCAAIGSGATAALLRVGKGLTRIRRGGEKVADQMEAGRTVDYISYLKHRRVLSSRTGGHG
jgi:3-hydroxy-3-methylglutaryl CoA synthase